MKEGEMMTMDGKMKMMPMCKIRMAAYYQCAVGGKHNKDADGQLRAINAVITDNTDRKKYEAELLLARRQAEQDLVKAVAYRSDDQINKWFGSYTDIDEQIAGAAWGKYHLGRRIHNSKLRPLSFS